MLAGTMTAWLECSLKGSAGLQLLWSHPSRLRDSVAGMSGNTMDPADIRNPAPSHLKQYLRTGRKMESDFLYIQGNTSETVKPV